MSYLVSQIEAGSGKSLYCATRAFCTDAGRLYAKMHGPQLFEDEIALALRGQNAFLSFFPLDERAFLHTRTIKTGALHYVDDKTVVMLAYDSLRASLGSNYWYAADGSPEFYWTHNLCYSPSTEDEDYDLMLSSADGKVFVFGNRVEMPSGVYMVLRLFNADPSFFYAPRGQSVRPDPLDRVWMDTESGMIALGGFLNPKIDGPTNAETTDAWLAIKRREVSIYVQVCTLLAQASSGLRDVIPEGFLQEANAYLEVAENRTQLLDALAKFGKDNLSGESVDAKIASLLRTLIVLAILRESMDRPMSFINGTVDRERNFVYENRKKPVRREVNPLSWQLAFLSGCMVDSITLFRMSISPSGGTLPGTIPIELLNEFISAQERGRYLAFWAKRNDAFDSWDMTAYLSGETVIETDFKGRVEDILVTDRRTDRAVALPFCVMLNDKYERIVSSMENQATYLVSWDINMDSEDICYDFRIYHIQTGVLTKKVLSLEVLRPHLTDAVLGLQVQDVRSVGSDFTFLGEQHGR